MNAINCVRPSEKAEPLTLRKQLQGVLSTLEQTIYISKNINQKLFGTKGFCEELSEVEYEGNELEFLIKKANQIVNELESKLNCINDNI